ncbi:MAG TPA: hypothetical protein DF613_06760, partial [Lachnospiraceae bacterium]|nr:hypothetical protein [Lachnospiraceae bacterium]
MAKRKRDLFQRMISIALTVVMLCGMLPETLLAASYRPPVQSVPTIEKLRNTKAGDYVSRVATPQDSPVVNKDYDRSYDNYEVKGDGGLLHPGILMNREELNIMRDMVWIGAEPWASRFAELQKSPYASLERDMEGPYEYINADRETYPLTRDAAAAYELALMW